MRSCLIGPLAYSVFCEDAGYGKVTLGEFQSHGQACFYFKKYFKNWDWMTAIT